MNAAAELPFQPQVDNAGAISGFMLAVVVHALLFAFLYFGINWISQPPELVEGTIWVTSPPTSTPVPPPPPAPKIVTPPEPPKPVVEDTPPPPVKADIEQKSQTKVVPPKPKVEDKPPPKKEKEQTPRKETANPMVKPPPADDPIRRELEKEEISRQLRKEDLSHQLAQETRAAGQRALGDWSNRVGALVRSRVPISVASAVPGNPTALFDVTVLPGGVVGVVRLVKSSGNAAYDEAAERAVQAISPLPAPAGGVPMPRSFRLEAQPKDQ